jgi:hypothetical protein
LAAFFLASSYLFNSFLLGAFASSPPFAPLPPFAPPLARASLSASNAASASTYPLYCNKGRLGTTGLSA